jgi:hypothetical protein
MFSFEKRSYFIRKPDENPNHYWTYNADNCETAYHEFEGDITENQIGCYMDYSDQSFEFDFDTEKFTYTRLRSWQNKSEKTDYYGGSAVIAMGLCKPYYR